MKPLAKDKIEQLINPRPDLAEDVDDWARLLLAAYGESGGKFGGLFGALHTIRRCGARLMRTGDRLQIVRPENYTAGEWDSIRQEWLMPYAVQLVAILERLAVPRPGMEYSVYIAGVQESMF